MDWATAPRPSAPKLQQIISAGVRTLSGKVEETSDHRRAAASYVIRLDGHDKVASSKEGRNARRFVAARGLQGYLPRVLEG